MHLSHPQRPRINEPNEPHTTYPRTDQTPLSPNRSPQRTNVSSNPMKSTYQQPPIPTTHKPQTDPPIPFPLSHNPYTTQTKTINTHTRFTLTRSYVKDFFTHYTLIPLRMQETAPPNAGIDAGFIGIKGGNTTLLYRLPFITLNHIQLHCPD